VDEAEKLLEHSRLPLAWLGPAARRHSAVEQQRRSALAHRLPRPRRRTSQALPVAAVAELSKTAGDQPAIGMIDNAHTLADRCLGRFARLQDEQHLVVLQGQRSRQSALLLPGERVVEIVARAQPPVQILAVRRRFGKARVVVGDEGREEGVTFSQGSSACQPSDRSVD
jgi:hypothetical protein